MPNEPPLHAATILTAPITARLATRSFALRRGLMIGLTLGLHLLLVAGIVLTDLLVVEIMKPPRAATRSRLVFHPPGPAPAGGGRTSGSSPASPSSAPRLQVPPPKPVVFALPPPADAVASNDSVSGPFENTGDGDGLDSGSGAPGDGEGDGGDGLGGPRGSDGPGFDSEIPLSENHPGLSPPVLIAASRAYPRYPELARKAGVQASVILLVVIDAEGRVGSIEVVRSPDPRYGFDLATIEAVKQWRYRPALLAGRPVAVQASITFEFSLSR